MLVAGVDSSTQSTKVLLCQADDGTIVGRGSAPHPPGTVTALSVTSSTVSGGPEPGTPSWTTGISSARRLAPGAWLDWESAQMLTAPVVASTAPEKVASTFLGAGVVLAPGEWHPEMSITSATTRASAGLTSLLPRPRGDDPSAL